MQQAVEGDGGQARRTVASFAILKTGPEGEAKKSSCSWTRDCSVLCRPDCEARSTTRSAAFEADGMLAMSTVWTWWDAVSTGTSAVSRHQRLSAGKEREGRRATFLCDALAQDQSHWSVLGRGK